MLIYIGSHCAPIAIPATTANGVSAQMLEVKLHAQVAPAPKEPMPIQFPLEQCNECIDIFENGPRLASAALRENPGVYFWRRFLVTLSVL